ncbi:Ovarian cancer-associated protein 2 [Coemansia javaensis]|uniref:Ovarian cancer-associated protein 2 n=1 Tax=Coemansia javaensis TaxID=2761396 RepID=A0A9W8LET8_9FUNG|nr:Ovarian cancer-associated protein 2 [Coemansia javaensis]
MPSPTAPPLRVLCLHGYMQNAKVFRQRTGALRKGLRKQLELVYVTAPHTAADFGTMPAAGTLATQQAQLQGVAAGDEDPHRAAWWNHTADTMADDVVASARFLRDVVREQGPFEGVLGFSQGATMAAIMLALIRNRGSPKLQRDRPELAAIAEDLAAATAATPLRLGIFAGGFCPTLPLVDSLVVLGAPIAVPSLHLLGRKDAVVPMYRSRQLATTYFAKPDIEMHEGGHVFPWAASMTSLYTEFIRRAMACTSSLGRRSMPGDPVDAAAPANGDAPAEAMP